jgi:hypothetical protein
VSECRAPGAKTSQSAIAKKVATKKIALKIAQKKELIETEIDLEH